MTTSVRPGQRDRQGQRSRNNGELDGSAQDQVRGGTPSTMSLPARLATAGSVRAGLENQLRCDFFTGSDSDTSPAAAAAICTAADTAGTTRASKIDGMM